MGSSAKFTEVSNYKCFRATCSRAWTGKNGLLASVGSVTDPMLLKHLLDQLADLVRRALPGDGG